MSDRRSWFLVVLCLAAAASRIAPHPMNFAPMTALALFGGATFASRRTAILAPLIALFLSDCLLQLTFRAGYQPNWGFYPGQWIAYACMGLTIGLGFLIRGRTNLPTVAAATLGGSVLFFLVTNFPWPYGLVWWHPTNLVGITASYTDALPFFRRTLAGDAVYSTLLFGTLALAEVRFPSLRRSQLSPAPASA